MAKDKKIDVEDRLHIVDAFVQQKELDNSIEGGKEDNGKDNLKKYLRHFVPLKIVVFMSFIWLENVWICK